MKRVQKMGILILVLVLLTGVFVTGSSMAATPPKMEVKVEEYLPSEGFLRLSFTQVEGGSTEIAQMVAPEGYAESWDTIKANTKTLWIDGGVVTKYTSTTFSGFSGVTCMILDAPYLETASSSSSLSKVTHLYYTAPSDLIDSVFTSSKLVVKKHIDNPNVLCKVTVGEFEHGSIVRNDIPAYVVSGMQVNVVVVPDAGYSVGMIHGGSPVPGSDTLRVVTEDVVFTADCYVYKELFSEDSFGDCSTSSSTVKWYLYNDGELVIVGRGAFTHLREVLKPWKNDVTSITIGEGVTAIPASAFNLPNLRTVTISTTVTEIGKQAFYACQKLEEALFLGDRPKSLGTQVFYSASDTSDLVGLFSVVYVRDSFGTEDLRDGTRAYPTRSKYDSYSEFSILSLNGEGQYVNSQGIVFRLNESNKTASVGTGSGRNNSRYNGNNNGEVYIPEEVMKDGQAYAVTSIAPNAFSDPDATSTDALKNPSQYYGNVFLKKLTLGANVLNIAPGAFYGCPNFEAFEVRPGSKSFRELDGILYDSRMGYLYVVPAAKHFSGTYEVPSSIIRIETGAFYGCTGIEKVEVRSHVSEIGDRAFFNASGIWDIRILSDVKTIGERAFNGCTSLSYLEIYAGLSTLGEDPFTECKNLRTLILPFLGTSPSNGVKLTKLFSTSSGPNVPVYTLCVAGGTLVKNALQNCDKLQSAYFGASHKVIPASCFDGCHNLSRLDFGTEHYNVRLYGNDAYSGTANIRAYVTQIGEAALKDCFSLARFAVDEDNAAFANDYWGALYDKEFTTLISFPTSSPYEMYCVKGTAETIENYAFCSCNNLQTLNIPSGETQPKPNSITPFPPTFRICVHKNSAAESVYGTLKCWIIDDFAPESIQIAHLSDRVAFETGGTPEYRNLYFRAVYPGVTILLDDIDYTLSLSGTDAGAQTATATYNQKDRNGKDVTEQFHIYLFKKQSGYTVAEYEIPSTAADLDKLNGFTALYDQNGKMLYVCESVMIDNVHDPDCNILRCAGYVPKTYLDGSATTLKLFTLDGLAPGMRDLTELWLPTPSLLTWGTAYNRNTGAAVARKGEISWKLDENDENIYELKVYKVGAGTNGADRLIGSSIILSSARVGQYFDCKDYLPLIKESGSGQYYFTVQSICYCDAYRQGCTLPEDSYDLVHADSDTCSCGLHHRSKPVRSEIFDYKQPSVTLEPCTDPQWSEDHRELRWTLPSDTSQYGGYTITFYYGREYSDYTGKSGRRVGSTTLYFDVGESYLNDSCMEQIERFYAQNEYRAGYYWFTVTAEPKDMTAANRSAESEWSTAAYYEGVPGYQSPYYIFVKANTEANNPDKPLHLNGKKHYAYNLYINGWLTADVYLNDALPEKNPAGIYTYTADYNNIYTLTPVAQDTYQKVVTVDLKSGDIKNGKLTLAGEDVKADGVELTNMVVNVSGIGTINSVNLLETTLDSKTVTVTYLARKDRDGNWLPTGPIYVTDVK